MAGSNQPVQFGRFLLTDRIAVGGMAEIFLAKVQGAMGFEKSMVIKRILPQYAADAEFLRMFVTEAKLVCQLEHPNIVQVYELGETDGQYYIAMETVAGTDGRELWRTMARRRQRLPGVLSLYIASEFLKGLDYAHRAVGPDGRLLGVVHRDISPSNVMISFRGDVKVGDFGIALVEHESRTQAGVLKGKYGYMSPEQVAGVKVDHRSDIFSAGIVLTEMLLGRRLFLGRNDFETLDKVLNVRLDVLEKNSEALPPEVVAISERALHQEPHHRYQSAREFHDAIMELLYAQGKRITNETLAAFMAQHVVPHLKRPSLAELSTSGLFPKSPVRAPLAAGKGAPGADASGGEDRPGTDSEAKGMPDITPSPSSAPPSNGEGKAASALGLGQAVDPPPGQAGSTPLAPQEPALDPQEILKNQGEGSSDQLDSGELDLDSDPGNEADSDGS